MKTAKFIKVSQLFPNEKITVYKIVMKFFDRIFDPTSQPVFPIIFREQDRSICSRCLCFYQGAYGCLRCQREVDNNENGYFVVDACPHCHDLSLGIEVKVVALCRGCNFLGDTNWIRSIDLRVMAVLSERDFELFANVAFAIPTVTVDQQHRYFMLSSKAGTEFVLWTKPSTTEKAITNPLNLLHFLDYLWIDAEGEDPLKFVRKIDAFVREWLIDDAKIKQVRAAVWQASLDPIIANWLAAHFDEVYYNVLPETVLNLPIGGTPLSVLMKKRGF